MFTTLTKTVLALSLAFVLAAVATQAKAVSVPSGDWGVDVDVAFNKKAGGVKHYAGSFLFDGDALAGSGSEVLTRSTGLLGASLKYNGNTYNPAGAKAKFVDGEIVGLVLKFKNITNGKKVVVKFDDFLVANKLAGSVGYNGAAYALALADANAEVPTVDDPVTAVPTPAAVTSGLALLAALGFRRRSKQN